MASFATDGVGGLDGGLILGTSGVASFATDGVGGLDGVTFGAALEAAAVALSLALLAKNFNTLKAAPTGLLGINSSPTISDTSFLFSIISSLSSLSSLSEPFLCLCLCLSLDLLSSKDSLLKILLTISISASETPNLLCNVTDIPYSKLHLFILLYIIYVIWIGILQIIILIIITGINNLPNIISSDGPNTAATRPTEAPNQFPLQCIMMLHAADVERRFGHFL